jgi:hypothetical protein
MRKCDVGSFLYRNGVDYYGYGSLTYSVSGKRKKYGDYFQCKSLSEEQKTLIKQSIPTVEFKVTRKQYAPEQTASLIVIPIGKIK